MLQFKSFKCATRNSMAGIETKRSVLGTVRVSYNCPNCNERLRSPLSDAGQTDHCPNCKTNFLVPGSKQLQQIQLEHEAAERLKHEKTIQRREAKRQKQIARDDAKFEAKVEAERRQQELVAEKNAEVDEDTPPAEQGETNQPPLKRNPKTKWAIIAILIFVAFLVLFRSFCGIFVIQPIGAIPDGVTIVYWRNGLNLPFVASADGILDDSDAGVSLLGRGMVLGELAEPIREREIFRFGYSKTLYLWSTGGKEFSK